MIQQTLFTREYRNIFYFFRLSGYWWEWINNELDDCQFCLPCVFHILWKFNLHSSAYSNVYLLYKFVLTLACTQVFLQTVFLKIENSQK